jgi:hypothetical protein
MCAWISALVTVVAVADSAELSRPRLDSSTVQPSGEWHQPMDIVVRLQPAVARALHDRLERQELPPAAQELLTILDRYGAEIRAQHPGSTDPELTAFFTVLGATGDKVMRLRQALADLEAVDAAYTKPPPAMP